jgi:hypothetical protein
MKPVKDRSESITMKSFLTAATVAVLLYVPVITLAQSNGPITRAQVKAELTQLEQAGYAPNSDQPDYPAGLHAAEARVQNPSGDSNDNDNSGYGGKASHSSQSGARTALPGDRSSIYFGD